MDWQTAVCMAIMLFCALTGIGGIVALFFVLELHRPSNDTNGCGA